ncbi:MAG TPA: TatD family hydrolase [Abditibacteriaceae bacterium]|jgi:TatD DNase family protein
MFFDSHCHLTSEQLVPNYDRVLERALANRVAGFLNIGDNLASTRAAIAQAETAQLRSITMYATAGVHPQNALEYSPETTEMLRDLAAHPLVRAIGEIGLDFVYDETHAQHPGAPRAMQESVLRQQLELATDQQLPVVIHNREADEALLRVLREYSDALPGGVFHCFGSSREVARQVLDMGFHLGFTGLVTFKNAQSVRDVAQFCPRDRILIETDSPYLAPVPHRGKTNEPAFLPRVAETIAALHDIGVEELAEVTTQNAQRLFAPA